jgi:hypothetical protein
MAKVTGRLETEERILSGHIPRNVQGFNPINLRIKVRVANMVQRRNPLNVQKKFCLISRP